MKRKLKNEFEIKLPKLFKEKIVGKTFADKDHKIIGRKFTVYAKDIWDKTQKYYYKFNFKIDKIGEKGITTSFIGHEVSRAFISKNVKKSSTRIDLYVKGKTKDGIIFVLKPIVITTMNVKTSIARSIRKEIRKFIELYIKENNLDKIIKEIISDDLQRDLKKSLNAIYPVSIVEIRKSEVKLK
jgi:small subunit ribosomal protein S3Ae